MREYPYPAVCALCDRVVPDGLLCCGECTTDIIAALRATTLVSPREVG